jgi:ribosomal protein S18 acetylase RimI-like enzyme
MLPAGFQARPATPEDLEAVAAVVAAVGLAEYGEVDYTPADLAHAWRDLDFAHDAWVVQAPGGTVLGYADVVPRLPNRYGTRFYVHPADPDQAVATYLIERVEARARERMAEVAPAYPVLVTHRVAVVNRPLQALLAARGYAPVRRFVDMHIKMDAPPPAPTWPASITVRPFVPGQDDRAVFDAEEEAFADHWGHIPAAEGEFEEWQRGKLEDPNFDPALWFLALDGDQIAGVLIGVPYPDYGWVDTLGVRRPWRQHGLGLALLHAAFGAFYARGLRDAYLGVDADSLTGAPRLYTRAGMHVTREYDSYRKEVRPAAP